jgi:tetratricopeptide (TPR) repeat protein
MPARYELTPQVMDELGELNLSPQQRQALESLRDAPFSDDQRFLAALFGLPAPPTNVQAAAILRRADRWYREAVDNLRSGYQAQVAGKLAEAERLYLRSIGLYPTAEAHTFLGWTYSFSERYDEAIAQCRKAIAVDPEFGNPYNDIGAYLIALGRPEEAIPWLEQATQAPRYEPRHFPWANLGRVYEALNKPDRALEHYVRAVELEPTYRVALEGIDRLTGPPSRLN